MSIKRPADTELTHDNWADEEEPEEVGCFKKASADVIQKRVIKSAKRRNPIRAEGEEKTNLFSKFASTNADKPTNTTFSFFNASNTKGATTSFNGIDKKDSSNSATASPFGSGENTIKNLFALPVQKTSSTNLTLPSNDKTTPASPNSNWDKYCAKLKGLNERVAEWITKKVKENPLISLQPIFKDYEKYLEEIDANQKSAQVQSNNSSTLFSVSKFSTTSSTSKENNTSKTIDITIEKDDEKSPNTSPTKITSNKEAAATTTAPSTSLTTSTSSFKFGLPTAVSETTTSMFKFGSSSNTTPGAPPKPFSSLQFNNSPPKFSFGSRLAAANAAAATTTLTKDDDANKSLTSGTSAKTEPTTEASTSADDAEDEPPKVEFKQVVEEDYVYTIKCKVFAKKGTEYGDRGVGNLYLKRIKDSEKIQLIVRANTNLGNLLLNFILSKEIPIKRLGKKDVMIVTIPTPDSKPPPVPLLIRVKSSDDADRLFDILENYKK